MAPVVRKVVSDLLSAAARESEGRVKARDSDRLARMYGRALVLGGILACTSTARADDVTELERIHSESLHTRRVLADAVLINGLIGLAGGGLLMIPEHSDRAWRFAGINVAVFGAINTVVGLRALYGIAREERTWEDSRADRRTPAGLRRARIHAVEDERRESVGHGVNLGLDCAYFAVGTLAIITSRTGVEHPNRWLASGVAVVVQSLFLVGVDLIGLTRSGAYHAAFVESLAPAVSIAKTPAGTEVLLGVQGALP